MTPLQKFRLLRKDDIEYITKVNEYNREYRNRIKKCDLCNSIMKMRKYNEKHKKVCKGFGEPPKVYKDRNEYNREYKNRKGNCSGCNVIFKWIYWNDNHREICKGSEFVKST